MTKRVISAVVMIALFIPFLILGGWTFTVLMTVLSVMGLYELLHIRESKKSFPKLMKIIAYLMVVFFTTLNSSSSDFSYNISYKVVSIILFTFVVPMVFINGNS